MRALAAAALANAFVRIFPASSLRARFLKQLAMFCGAILFVWLLTLTCGLDLSAGLF
ncbi:response regulator [Bradyrhizobium monzae]|uniref:response regulator n=1 Tax=Bradyrhizobium sp. Oc8 TaxID=2876780 RepID=UPI001F295748|nr:response regulator [Bradyrhizobium sp. Oc8]